MTHGHLDLIKLKQNHNLKQSIKIIKNNKKFKNSVYPEIREKISKQQNMQQFIAQ
jgi:hypothetical protein